jgi:DNA-binding Lrp family transcriptional regulator
MIKDKNHVVIQGWMVTRLQLKGASLLIYAIIHSFSQIEDHYFHGSLQYLAEWTNSSKQTVLNNLKELLSLGLIERRENIINNVKFVEYKSVLPEDVEKDADDDIDGDDEEFDQYSKNLNGVVKKFEWGSQKILPNNINNKISDKDILEKKNIKKKSDEDTKRQTIDSLIESYGLNEEVEKTVREFIQYRKEKKWDLTLTGLKKLLNKLLSLSKDPTVQINILNESMERGYRGIFEIKEYNQSRTKQSNNVEYRDYMRRVF